MEYLVTINGLEVKASYSEDSIQTIYLPLLHHLVDLQKEKGRRILVMLAAPPGAGKSTLCSFLKYLSEEYHLAKMDIIGMDGFHLRHEYLQTHFVEINNQKVKMVDIKGAPVTFDLDGLSQRIKSLTTNSEVGWPTYNRMLHNPEDNKILVKEDIVLLEGNYLLLNQEGWNKLHEYADYTIRIDANPKMLHSRLLERKFASNHDLKKAEEFVERSDLVNAKLCLENSLPADLTLELLENNEYKKVER